MVPRIIIDAGGPSMENQSRRDRRADLPPVHVLARGGATWPDLQPVPGGRRAAPALPLRPAGPVPGRLRGRRPDHGPAPAALDRLQPHRGRRVRGPGRVARRRAGRRPSPTAPSAARSGSTTSRRRPPRALADNEVLDLGGRRVRRLDTPHVPHCWDAGLLYEETTGTLFTSDLFTARGQSRRGDRRRHHGPRDGGREAVRLHRAHARRPAPPSGGWPGSRRARSR